MKTIEEYKELSAKVRAARAFFEDTARRATACHEVYDLNGENKMDKCINKYKKVLLPNGQVNDEGGMTVYCEHLLGDQVFCDIWKCDVMKQYERFCYIKAKQEMEDAIAARRAFVRDLFRLKKHSK